MIETFLQELLGRFLLLQLMDQLALPETIDFLLLHVLDPGHIDQVGIDGFAIIHRVYKLNRFILCYVCT